MGETSEPVCLTFEARPLQLLELPDHHLIVGCIIDYNPTDIGKGKIDDPGIKWENLSNKTYFIFNNEFLNNQSDCCGGPFRGQLARSIAPASKIIQT